MTGNISDTKEHLLKVRRDSRGKGEGRTAKIGKKVKFQGENEAK